MFHGLRFVLGKASRPLQQLIEEHGGVVGSKLGRMSTYFVQSYNDDDDGRLETASRLGVAVVPPSFVSACVASGALLDFVEFAAGQIPVEGFDPPLWPRLLEFPPAPRLFAPARADAREAHELPQTVDEFACMDRIRLDPQTAVLWTVVVRVAGRSQARAGALTELQSQANGFCAAHFALETRSMAPLTLKALDGEWGLVTGDSFYPIRSRGRGAARCFEALDLIAVLAELRPAPDALVVALCEGAIFEASSDDSDSDECDGSRLLGRATGDGACVVGLPAHDGSLLELVRTIVHEGSHMLGLDHCAFFACAMNANAVADAVSPLFFCCVCERKAWLALGFDPTARCRALLAACERLCFDAEALWLRTRLAGE
eukprot:Amastigsp_a339316_50.p1 type:complete len:373 gc:universal Amastigsp_a339316_50:118-1236(+)